MSLHEINSSIYKAKLRITLGSAVYDMYRVGVNSWIVIDDTSDSN